MEVQKYRWRDPTPDHPCVVCHRRPRGDATTWATREVREGPEAVAEETRSSLDSDSDSDSNVGDGVCVDDTDDDDDDDDDDLSRALAASLNTYAHETAVRHQSKSDNDPNKPPDLAEGGNSNHHQDARDTREAVCASCRVVLWEAERGARPSSERDLYANPRPPNHSPTRGEDPTLTIRDASSLDGASYEPEDVSHILESYTLRRSLWQTACEEVLRWNFDLSFLAHGLPLTDAERGNLLLFAGRAVDIDAWIPEWEGRDVVGVVPGLEGLCQFLAAVVEEGAQGERFQLALALVRSEWEDA